MPYKSNADKAAWARRKYHGNEEFRKAEISAVTARRNARIAREVQAMPRKSYQPPAYKGRLCGQVNPDHRVGGVA